VGIANHGSKLTHLLMVRMARSPRLIWGTPSSQPVRHTSVNNLHAIPTSSTPGAIHATRTLDETTNADGGGQRGATVTGAVEPIRLSVSGCDNSGGEGDLLVAHEVVVGLAGVIQTASVVESDIVAHLGVGDAVTVRKSLLLDAHFDRCDDWSGGGDEKRGAAVILSTFSPSGVPDVMHLPPISTLQSTPLFHRLYANPFVESSDCVRGART
jgi:hypothetical protein